MLAWIPLHGTSFGEQLDGDDIRDMLSIGSVPEDDAIMFARTDPPVVITVHDPRGTFATVEIEPGRFLSDSDELIEHYASMYHIEVNELPALSFYLQTIFPRLLRLHESQWT